MTTTATSLVRDPGAPAEHSTPVSPVPSYPSPRVHAVTFWLAAVAFLLNMAFSAVPTPLYVLFQQRDHFSDLMITVVYAVYAVGVIASLFLWGHLSDWYGRRRLLVPALLANVVSAVIFISAPSLAGLMVARVISGVAVGLSIATATSYLAELHGRARPGASGRRAQVVATSANLGGIGLGPLAAGLLAQFAPWPMRLSFIVFGAALLVLAGGMALSPETVRRPELMPPYRVQRVSVPAHSKGLFRAATGAAMASFAVLGVFNSLVPSFLLGSLHESSHALAGAVAFAAFAASAVAQIVTPRTPTSKLLRWGVPIVALGLALLTGGMWNADLVMFVVGGILTGGGAGLVFKGAVSAIYRIAPLESRAETLAGFFLGAYVGLSIPVVGLGVATAYWSERNVMLVFVVITAAAIALSARGMLRGFARLDSPEPNPVVQDQAADGPVREGTGRGDQSPASHGGRTHAPARRTDRSRPLQRTGGRSHDDPTGGLTSLQPLEPRRHVGELDDLADDRTDGAGSGEVKESLAELFVRIRGPLVAWSAESAIHPETTLADDPTRSTT